jgi:hypothetical protein
MITSSITARKIGDHNRAKLGKERLRFGRVLTIKLSGQEAIKEALKHLLTSTLMYTVIPANVRSHTGKIL